MTRWSWALRAMSAMTHRPRVPSQPTPRASSCATAPSPAALGGSGSSCCCITSIILCSASACCRPGSAEWLGNSCRPQLAARWSPCHLLAADGGALVVAGGDAGGGDGLGGAGGSLGAAGAATSASAGTAPGVGEGGERGEGGCGGGVSTSSATMRSVERL